MRLPTKPPLANPSVMLAGINAFHAMRKFWDRPAPTRWAELFRQLCNMEVRPVKPQGKTHRQLEKQRARNQRRRPRAWFKAQP